MENMFGGIFRRRVFGVSFLVFAAGRYVLSAQEVVSFSFFKVWTLQQNIKLGQQYVREGHIDNTVVGTVIANVSFGQGAYYANPTIADAIRLFDSSRALVSTDVLELLRTSQYPEQTLTTHIKHVDRTVNQIDALATSLSQLADNHLQESQRCLSLKREGDTFFFEGIQSSDQ
jgi:hypothetical protein